jgi:riboflavin kinase / FMN adenylyltransferase
MTMHIYHGLPADPLEQPCFLSIGNFDGVHRGHQALIESMQQAARAAGCQAGLLTFNPHPLAVVRPGSPLRYLTTMSERIALLQAHGLDFIVVLPFTRETAATSAADFMQALVAGLRLRSLWIGPDFALGRGREGTPARLQELGQAYGYSVELVQPYQVLAGPVHSSRIRAVLREDGAVDIAAQLLGRPYQVWGQVARGAARGRDLGFPTANLTLPADRLVPAFGIYACWAWLGAAGRPAAVSIGVRPTFDNGAPSVEAFLLDHQGDLYGERVGLSFIERLRPELKFPSAEALIAQMAADVEATRRILGNPESDAGEEPGWEEEAHTADWSIRVRGSSQRQLFARAAAAMYSLQDADTKQPVRLAREIAVVAKDPAELLVVWLNALLAQDEIHGEMYTRFAIHDLSAQGLRGIAYGYHGAPSHTEIKAVTYWGLDVAETPTGWTATVTFDV